MSNLVTKNFKITGLGTTTEVDIVVNKALKPEFEFDCWCAYSCIVPKGEYEDELLKCVTPDALVDAIINHKPMTFSVTLPAEYWK